MKPLIVLAALIGTTAAADWTAANPEVTAAAKNPRVAAVLKRVEALDTAIIVGDKDGFTSAFADDAIVNSPFNNISTKAMAAARYKSGALTYEYLHRSIEYAGPRRDDEVVLMGEESYIPPVGNPLAGKVVRRRFTDLWRLQGGKWLLSIRQATVFEVK